MSNKNIQICPSNNFKITIDYLANVTFDTSLDAGETRTGKLVENRHKNIVSDYVITNVSTTGVDLTEFDRAVLNATIAEHSAGNEFTTAGRIYRRLGGSYNLGDTMRRAILDSVERLASVRITVEIEKARKEHIYGVNVDKSTFKGYLLPTESLETTINGQHVDAIHILGKGMVFGIADIKAQIITLDQDLMQAPIRHSERGIAINHYIVRRTLEIKGSHEAHKSNKHVRPLNKVILFETMLKKCGLENATRDQRFKVRKIVKKILDYEVELGIIKSYAFEFVDGGKIRSIILEL